MKCCKEMEGHVFCWAMFACGGRWGGKYRQCLKIDVYIGVQSQAFDKFESQNIILSQLVFGNVLPKGDYHIVLLSCFNFWKTRRELPSDKSTSTTSVGSPSGKLTSTRVPFQQHHEGMSRFVTLSFIGSFTGAT